MPITSATEKKGASKCDWKKQKKTGAKSKNNQAAAAPVTTWGGNLGEKDSNFNQKLTQSLLYFLEIAPQSGARGGGEGGG